MDYKFLNAPTRPPPHLIRTFLGTNPKIHIGKYSHDCKEDDRYFKVPVIVDEVVFSLKLLPHEYYILLIHVQGM